MAPLLECSRIYQDSAMKLRTAFILSLTLSNLGYFELTAAGEPHGLYGLETEIAIGGDGGWDYLSLDEQARRLYATHSTRVVVIDLETHQVVGNITNTPGVHGFAIAPGLHRGFSSDGRDSKASLVDLTTLKSIPRVATGEGPDAILFEPGRQEVFAFNGRGNSATIFKANSGDVITTLPLLGQPEFAVADPQSSRVYCNLEDKNELLAIDTKTDQALKRWSVAPGESPSGLAIDFAHQRLLVGCHNNLMLMVNAEEGRVVSSVPIGQGADANAFDPATQVAFSCCGDGTVTVARELTPEELKIVQTLTTEKGAKTMALDLRTHRIYLASAKYETSAQQTSGAQRPRKVMVPASFKVAARRNGESLGDRLYHTEERSWGLHRNKSLAGIALGILARSLTFGITASGVMKWSCPQGKARLKRIRRMYPKSFSQIRIFPKRSMVTLRISASLRPGE